MQGVEALLAVARRELGYTESPAGSNRTKYGKWFGLDGQPWCMMFVQWCCKEAGLYELLPLHTASCGSLMRGAQMVGQWVTGGYLPGDIVIYDFPGGALTDHTGIVERVDGANIVAIEGNTGSGNDANGGQVQRRVRPLSQVVGACRLKFEEEEDVDWSKITAADINRMPDAAIDALCAKMQTRQSQRTVGATLAEELQAAVAAGITDGTSPQAFCTRAQAAIMAKRAAKK